MPLCWGHTFERVERSTCRCRVARLREQIRHRSSRGRILGEARDSIDVFCVQLLNEPRVGGPPDLIRQVVGGGLRLGFWIGGFGVGGFGVGGFGVGGFGVGGFGVGGFGVGGFGVGRLGVDRFCVHG